MENKSPFLPSEAEFVAQTEEQGDATEKKDSKKKKGAFQTLLEKLIPRQSTQEAEPTTAPDEKDRSVGFFERFKGTLNSFFGVEKAELPESLLQSTAESKLDQLRAPILAPIGVEADLESMPTVPAADQEEIKSRTTTPTSVHEELNHSMTEEAISLNDSMSIHELPDIPVVSTDEVLPAHEVRYLDQQLPSEPSVGESRSDVLEDKRLQPRYEHTTQGKETIFERNSGGGAALLGFVAAETLSRSRDKKLRREAEQLRQKVDRQEAEQQFTTQEIHRVTQRNAHEIKELRNKRTEALQTPQVHETTNLTQPIEKAHVTSEKRVEQQKPLTVSSEKETEPLMGTLSHEDTPEKRILQAHVEQAAEKDVALEGYYEKRAEVKDVPTAAPQSIGYGAGVMATTTSVSPSRAHTISTNHPQSPEGAAEPGGHVNLYKDSIRQGATVGLAIIAGLVIIALVWNLL
jgi:hypothetical protein